MTQDGVAIARSLLDRLEAGIAASDLPALTELCADDIVLFGSARANFGAEETRRYLGMVAEFNSTVRWFLDRWSVLHQDDQHLLVAGDGEVEFDEGTGADRSEFRLTMWLVREAGDWKIRHFHGSVPEA